jgi:hypothetical protein
VCQRVCRPGPSLGVPTAITCGVQFSGITLPLRSSAIHLPRLNRLFFRLCSAFVLPLKTIFFFAKPATVRGRSAARTCQGRGFSRVHRRPLTGSTAGITPVLQRRGLSGEKNGRTTSSAKNTLLEKISGQQDATWSRVAGRTQSRSATKQHQIQITGWAGRKIRVCSLWKRLMAERVDYGNLDHVLRTTESQYGKTVPAAHLSEDLRFVKGLNFIRGGGLRACS